jgi:inner membrane protein
LVDTVTAVEVHRGFSHSIFFAVTTAPLLGWLVWRLYKKQLASWKSWSLLFFWGLFTHPILDAFTTWGTQLFWPFKTRLAFQSIFVIDPLYTLPFLILVLMAMRLHRYDPKRSRLNRWGLLISSGYLAVTLVLKGIANYEFSRALEEQQIAYTAVATRPSPFNTILWMANVETENAFLIGEYSFFDSKPISFRSIPKNHNLLGDLAKKDKVKRLIAITEGWYAITQKEGVICFNDMRFGLLSFDAEETQFAFSYELLHTNSELEVRELPKNREDGKKLLSALWMRVLGN